MYNCILQIKNTGSVTYNIRLNANSQTNLGRIGNFTAWFMSPASVQLQVLAGAYNTQTGPLVSIASGVIIQLAIYIDPVQTGTATINTVLQIYNNPATNTHLDYVITFSLK